MELSIGDSLKNRPKSILQLTDPSDFFRTASPTQYVPSGQLDYTLIALAMGTGGPEGKQCSPLFWFRLGLGAPRPIPRPLSFPSLTAVRVPPRPHPPWTTLGILSNFDNFVILLGISSNNFPVLGTLNVRYPWQPFLDGFWTPKWTCLPVKK